MAANSNTNADHPINAESWQPTLLRTLVDELASAADPLVYAFSKRGWRLLTVLSQCPWKNNEDYADLGDLKKRLLDPLSRLLTALTTSTSQDSTISPNDWEHLIRDGGAQRMPSTDRSNASKPAKVKREKRPKRIDPSRRQKSTTSSGVLSPSSSSFDSNMRPAFRSKKILSKKVLSLKLNVSPYILHEDSDGFPLCWNEFAPIPSTLGSHLWLDDTILDLLHAQTPIRPETSSVIGSIAQLLAVIRQIIRVLRPDDKQRDVVLYLVTILVSWEPVDEARWTDRRLNYLNDPEVALAGKKSVALVRHWSATIEQCLVVVAEHTAAFRQGTIELISGIKSMLSHAIEMVSLLSAFRSTEPNAFALWQATEQWIGQIVDNAHRLILGVLTIAGSGLAGADADHIADGVQITAQIINVLFDCGFADCVRDLAICYDHAINVYGPGGEAKFADKLFRVLSGCSQLATRLQKCKTQWLHGSMCRRTTGHLERCQQQIDSLMPHHNGLLEFEAHTDRQPFKRCCLAFLLNTLCASLRNMTTVAAKRCALQSILSCPHCCCVPPQVLLTSLLADLPDHKDDNQHLLMRCLGVHLVSASVPFPADHPCRLSRSSSMALSLEYCCRICGRDGELERSEPSGYVSALSEYFSSASGSVLIQLCKLVCSILPGLDAAGKELLVANAVLPRLFEQCKMSVDDSHKPLNGDQHDDRLIVALLKIAAEGVCGPKAYKSLIKNFFPFADFLFDCSLTQKSFVICLERGVLLEDSAEFEQKPLTRYVFDRFLLATRTAKVDVSTLISDSASRFHQVVTVTLDMCHAFLLHKCSGFVDIFCDNGGLSECCQLIDACLDTLKHGSYGGPRAFHRLTSLFSRAIRVALLTDYAPVKTQVLAALQAVFCGGDESMVTSGLLANQICCTLIECSVIPAKDATDLQRIVQFDSDEEESSENESEQSTVVNDGYNADEESPEMITGLPESKAFGDLKHPELCIVAVKHLQQLLACETSAQALDFATSNVCRLLQSICLHGDVNLQKLRQHDIVGHLHELARSLVEKEMQSTAVHHVLTLLAGFVCAKPSSSDLELIVKLLAEPNGSPAIVLDTLLEMLTETSFEPAECLIFPQVPLELLQKQKMSQSSPAGGVKRDMRSLSTKRRRETANDIEAARDVVHSLGSLQEPSIHRSNSSVLDTLGRFFSKSSSLHSSSSHPKMKDGAATLPNPRRTARQPYLPPFGHTSAAILRLERIGITLTDGLSIAFWSHFGRQARRADNNVCLMDWWHVATIGGEELSCSLYAHSESDHAMLKISSRLENVQEKRIRKIFPSDVWTHYVLAMIVESQDRLRIQVVVNGYVRLSWELGWSCDEVPLKSPFSVGFGCLQDVQTSSNFTHELSTILAFKGMISHQSAMLLRGLGPRCRTLADTKARTLESCLYSMLRPNLVASNSHKMISLLEDKDAFIESLQKSLLFCLVPTEAKMFGVYVLQPMPESTSPADAISYLCLTRVKSYPIEWKCQMQSRQLTSLDDAFVSLGGCRLFALLFARVIDMKTEERAQAAAFRLLFTAVRRHTEWWHEFVDINGDALVARCLSCPLAIVGQLMTFEIADASISGLERTEKGELRASTLAVIRDPKLLCTLVCRAMIWRGSKPFSHWVQLLEVLCSCVAETNICGVFNRHQLVRVGFLKSLLQTCLEMSQDPLDYGPALSGLLVANAIVPLVASLLGDPEEVSRITELWDFLFLSHSASCTYLNYRIIGHNDWINSDGFEEGPINLLGRESELASQLRHYVHVLGKEQLSYVLKVTNGSVAAVKLAYESALAGKAVEITNPSAGAAGQRRLSLTSSSSDSDDGDEESSRPSDSPIEQLVAHGGGDRLENVAPVLRARDSIPSLPDLICDINTDATVRDASTTSGDSADEAWSRGVSLEEPIVAEEPPADRRRAGIAENLWLVETRAGLLEVLAVVLQNGPDSVISRVIGNVVKWQPLIVMLNHQANEAVRDACVRALCVLLLRGDNAVRASFVKSNGFFLLANQLREYPCSPLIADSIFSLLCGEIVRLEDGLDAGHLLEMRIDLFNCGAVEPIFALLENSLHDISIFWNLSSSLQKVFENNPTLAQAMLENRLIETLVNTLQGLAFIEPKETDLYGAKDTGLMIDCWRSFANRVLQTCVCFSDLGHYQVCQDLIWLVQTADMQTGKSNNSAAHGLVRRQLCALLHTWLECIRGLFSDEGLSASAVVSMDSVHSVHLSQTIRNRHDSDQSTPVPSESRDGDAAAVHSSSTTSIASNAAKPKTGFLGGSFSNFREKFGALSNSQLNLKGRYKSRQSSQLASQSELTERLKFCLQSCVDLFIHLQPVASVSEEEEHLFEFYLYFLLSTAKKELSKEAPNRSQSRNAKNWHRLLWSCREKVRQLLARIVAFVLFPAEAKLRALATINEQSPSLCESARQWILRRQLLVARGLSNEVQYKQMLRTLLDINLDYQYAMNLALHELILLNQLEDMEELTDVEKLLRFLKHLRIESPLVDLTTERLNALSIDEQLCLQTYQEQRQQFIARLKTNISRLISKQQNDARSISQAAMSVTCQVVEEQNVPRKLFIQVTKAAFAESLQAEETLIVLVSDLCHPYAACYDKRSWPASWCLDPTEGPNRERRRLMPSHLSFDPRFLLPAERAKLDRKLCPPPLTALLDRSLGDGNSIGEQAELAGQLIDRLRIDEKIALSMSAMILRSTFECSGEVLLGDRRIYFVGESSRSTQKGLPQKQLISMSWEYSEIIEVYKRHHQLLDTAVEVFFCNGETYLIVFDDIEKRDYFQHRLLTMDLTNLIMYPENLLQAATRWWREGIITNFEYLTHLNKLAGRTFSDLMQYPVFPFILSDYTSTNLDLNNSAVFRNLAKPMAVQDKRMEEHYLINYKCLDSEAKRAPAVACPLVVFGPYHYGSHYSNSGIVVHYLVRVPPFTDMALEYQDHNFDIPDRLFNSLETTWRLSSFESTTDFKELIPEFFFFPEFLVNFEGLNLGVRQAGQQVNDVILPNWCPNDDPRLFVLVHRQALESQHVTAHLHLWIDLVLGYKQTGQPAIEAINVFHPATYHGTHYDVDGKDELTRSAIKTMVRTYGQMPKQLFKSPHLPHFNAKQHSFPPRNSVKGPLATVSGVRWGNFVGSPEVGEPVLVLKQRAASNVVWPAELSVIADGTCVALPQHCQILLKFRAAKREATPWKPKEIDCLGAVSWFFPDSVVRARILSPEPGGPWISLVALHDHKVTCSAFSIVDGRLFLGLASGVIRVFALTLAATSIKSCRLEKELVGHSGAVTTIAVCSAFSVVISGCDSGRLFLWDLNKLSFVRAFSSSGGPLSLSCVSSVSGDVGVVCQSGYGSRISLYSINGRLIASTETDISVTSITMTNLPDGTAVNVLAVGMQNGIIRLFNVWTMAPVREISHSSFLEPIVSLKFSNACKKLYAVTSSGTVLCWEGANTRQTAPPRFVFANPRL